MQILRSKVLHLAAALLAAFIPLIIFVNPDVLYLYTGCILLTTTIAFIHAYLPALKISIKMTVGELQKVDILTLALFLIFTVVGMREGYVVVSKQLFPLEAGLGRQPEYYLFLALCQYCSLVSALLAITARTNRMRPSFMDRVPGWPRAVISIGAGFIIATGFYVLT